MKIGVNDSLNEMKDYFVFVNVYFEDDEDSQCYEVKAKNEDEAKKLAEEIALKDEDEDFDEKVIRAEAYLVK